MEIIEKDVLFTKFQYQGKGKGKIQAYSWEPVPGSRTLGAVQIAHGMGEKAMRYAELGTFLAGHGFAVYTNDHLGHGKTARHRNRLGKLPGKAGFDRMVEDMEALTEVIRHRHRDLPFLLLGHSMGSFLVQRQLQRTGKGLAGAILSGSGKVSTVQMFLAALLAKEEMLRLGRHAPARLLHRLLFEGFNRKFSPNRTESDWLSRDGDRVDAYVKDPGCGFICSTGFYYAFFRGMVRLWKREELGKMDRKLPLLLLSGDKDPLGDFGKGVRRLARTYERLGFSDVTLKLYPGGRHEMFHETNREEVMEDLLAWMKGRISPLPTFSG
ncbi:alpha/beta hydrolase [Anaerotalea alkaliphila]|uniref:Alpha/beta hydrolase n=1 Tax=Anaerotalea alkaliphila TaxID=2662126 RepID=A0A7X5HXF3_9FIRM|nr:alpha/beta hydrolase [Anaerotalea alkaliphila]NDL68385.1 alpha/beta hydrolase [Anaerotalea alkaliphila]